MEEACATCARYLSHIPPPYCEKFEKSAVYDRRLDCCGRVICGDCIYRNSRFAMYCPFCQISTTPSPLPQGLKEPPSYIPLPSPKSTRQFETTDELPSYSSLNINHTTSSTEKSFPAKDVLHFLDHKTDTLTSLSFRYAVPISALRKTNNIHSDHLLLARRSILIPGEYYKGEVSLSPRPVEGEEEERRKAVVRRWMVRCKVSEYDVALLYLKQFDYDLNAAVEAFQDDERWEKDNPMQGNVKGRGKIKHDLGRRRFTGQRS
ncbi:hypothetical protein BGZ60DRAFT_73140 [Tricladium varicosporioides]|nr:hypothetical protein BGZ60DRAFT_73140 [Hymenoscyphus varicosporioides]